MKNLYRFTWAVLLVIAISSCGDDDGPNVSLSFETPNFVEVGVEFTFNNTSTGPTSYEWDFGDGGSSSDINPSHTYTEAGSYTVTLTAFVDGSQAGSTEQTVEVGQRVLTGISLTGISFIDPNGNDWDDNTGRPDSVKYPDLIVYTAPLSAPQEGVETPLLVDLAPAEVDAGILFTVTPGGNPFALTDEEWFIEFIDVDEPDSQDPQLQLMANLPFFPVQSPTSFVDPDTGEGVIQVAQGSYNIQFIFQIQ